MKKEIERVEKAVKALKKKCKKGTSKNPKTGRCAKNCKPGYARSKRTGKCTMIKHRDPYGMLGFSNFDVGSFDQAMERALPRGRTSPLYRRARAQRPKTGYEYM